MCTYVHSALNRLHFGNVSKWMATYDLLVSRVWDMLR